MNRIGHQAAAQFGWLTLSVMQPMDPRYVVAGAIFASATCADDWSPDCDQGGWMAKILPGGHRWVTHMPEVVALMFVALWQIAGPVEWLVKAAAVAWGTHLLVDMAFGRIPFLLLGGRRLGLRFKTGGRCEAFLTLIFTIASLPLAWIAFGGPLPSG